MGTSGNDDADTLFNADTTQYYADSDTTLEKLDACATDFIDLASYCSSIDLLIETVNDSLDGLTKVNQICTIKKVSTDTKLTEIVANSSTQLETRIKEIAIYFEAVDEYIDVLNGKGDPEHLTALQGLLKSGGNIAQWAIDHDAGWILESVCKAMVEVGKWNAIAGIFGSIVAYGTDTGMEGGSFTVDMIARKLIGDETQFIFGAGVAAAVTVLSDVYGDSGQWTDLDTVRTALDTTETFISVFTWNAVTSIVEAAATGAGAGAAAGPIGVAVGTAVGILSTIAMDTIIPYITGDNIVYTYVTEDGTEIPIPRNGNGANGTYDVLIEESYEIAEYDQLIYDDPQKAAEIWNNQRNPLQAYGDAENIQRVYDMLADATSAEDAEQIFENCRFGNYGDPTLTDAAIALDGLEFSAADYYNYVENGVVNSSK